MKKILVPGILVPGILAIVALIACGKNEPNAAVAATVKTTPTDPMSEHRIGNNGVLLWVDPETGCEYITRDAGSSSFTPRLNSNGTVRCGPSN